MLAAVFAIAFIVFGAGCAALLSSPDASSSHSGGGSSACDAEYAKQMCDTYDAAGNYTVDPLCLERHGC
jgi:hypothetical protein